MTDDEKRDTVRMVRSPGPGLETFAVEGAIEKLELGRKRAGALAILHGRQKMAVRRVRDAQLEEENARVMLAAINANITELVDGK